MQGKTQLQVAISIHAPRTGSDYVGFCNISRSANFNPRSPHGERLRHLLLDSGALKFQSTLPARGATVLLRLTNRLHPQFQSTLPARGATSQTPLGALKPTISIHAPRTGSDLHSLTSTGSKATFQSTLPARGATIAYKMAEQETQISIHAPRTGSDDPNNYKQNTDKISIHAPRTGSDVLVSRNG